MPVIYKIHFNSQEGLFNMSQGYSAFHGENEVLIQDGLLYKVKDIQTQTMEEKQIKCYIIILEYPPTADKE